VGNKFFEVQGCCSISRDFWGTPRVPLGVPQKSRKIPFGKELPQKDPVILLEISFEIPTPKV
jgi:hypothetical protein